MALANYSDLKTAIAAWGRRGGNATFVAAVPDVVTLAEAKLNRVLGPVETNASRTGTVDSRSISISALSIVEPLALWIADSGSEDERELQMQAPANMAYRDTSGRPTQWCVDSETNIKLDCPCDQAYDFRFRFRERFALSDSTTTNWLLTNHPDIYLAACMVWGAGYREDWENGANFAGILADDLPALQRLLRKQRKGTYRIDPALARVGQGGTFNYSTGQ
jgi:hypothetical protein